ncbi:MAG: LysR family transcriptional regulator [Proteobacteria bacterium]|nr:LysR family transcriptional regulator [Pseudomonadota bacterium]
MKDNHLSIRNRDGWSPRLERLTRFRASSASLALEMARAGVCAVYVPEFLIAHANERAPKGHQLSYLDLPPRRRAEEKSLRDVFLVKRASEDESKAMRAVTRIVRQVCKKAVD